jgi:hypothetical protein
MNTRTRTASPDMLTGTTHVDPLNADIGAHDKEISLSPADNSLEALRDSLNATVSHDINDPDFIKYTSDSAFMEEQVLVRIHESTDPNAEKIIPVYNDGIPQHFIRGQWTVCKRKFAEVLARAKPYSIATPEITDGNGDRTTAIRKTTALRYPFEMQDKNPRGQAWLHMIAQEA